jgi:hypothetical protein
VYGYLVHIRNSKGIETLGVRDSIYHVNDGYCNVIPTEVKPETVGQWTGKFDTNNVEIYQGDIARLNNCTALYTCTWAPDACRFYWASNVSNDYGSMTEEATIVSNIHEKGV